MKRYKIRRMAERLAVKIIRNLPLDRFEQELWHLAAIIEEHLFSELVQLDEAERRTEETEANFTLLPRSQPQVENCRTERPGHQLDLNLRVSPMIARENRW